MNYADMVKQKYPLYTLTRVGSGNTYEDLEWSVFNPLPNPIPKATLDADISDFAAQGYVGAVGDLTPEQTHELVAFAQLPESEGFVYKVGHKTYKLDTSTYLTGITSTQILAALGFTPYSDTNPALYTTKSYVDALTATGIKWIEPVEILNLIGNLSAPPASPLVGDAYFINTGGNTGAWSTFSAGDLVQLHLDGWVKMKDSTAMLNGDRYVIGAVTDTLAVGFASGQDNKLAVLTSGAGGAGETLTWTFSAVENNSAVFIHNPLGEYYGKSYLYNAGETKWTMFQSSNTYSAGEGLLLSGTAFDVKAGSGVTLVSDNVTVDLYDSAGLMLTLDGSTASTDPAAQLALTKTGITPGTYRTVTVDDRGRLTTGTNPNSLTGFGILDAQPLDTDLTAIAALTGTTGYLRKTAEDTWSLDSATLLPVTLTNPQAGQGLVFNGTNWVNIGSSGGSSGGAAKRIWSDNIESITGTSIITPAVAPPLSTAGTLLWSLTLIPSSTLATYVLQSSLMVAGSNNGTFITVALFRGTTYIGSTLQVVQSSSNSATLSLSITDKPNTASPVTYTARIGINSNTWYVNRRNNENTYGGTKSGWVVWEY